MAGSNDAVSPHERGVIHAAMMRAQLALNRRGARPTYTTIAKATDSNVNTVKKYLSGERRPTVEFVRRLAGHAGMPIAELFVALEWLPAHEMLPPGAASVAADIAALAATVGRLEPHVRQVLEAPLMVTSAPFAAAAALLSDIDGATRFDVRQFKVVSGRTYPAVTNACAEFRLKPGMAPLRETDLDQLVRRVGLSWRPRRDSMAADPDYWSVQLELRARTYVLNDTDLGQHTWQGEPGTRAWAGQASTWPAHVLVQDTLGGIPWPGRADGWRPAAPRTLIVVGARYSSGIAAATVAEALGWQFVPVRSDVTVTADGRFVPVTRERPSGRVSAWRSIARHIGQRARDGDPWPAVVLLRPSALRNRDRLDEVAFDLLRDTPASVVYVRPSAGALGWWAARQTSTSVPTDFDADCWLTDTAEELRYVEAALGRRDGRNDLHLQGAGIDAVAEAADAVIPDELMNAQAAIAWTVLGWLDRTANHHQPSLLSRVSPGTFATWLPALAADPAADVPKLAPA